MVSPERRGDESNDKSTAMFESLAESSQESKTTGDVQSGTHSFIHRMPFEVMAYCFKIYVRDTHDSSRFPSKGALPLGAVCRLWRHIAWTTPHLWTTLKFQFQSAKTTERHIELAIDWLGRSGQLPLSIYLSTGRHALRPEDEVLFLPLIHTIDQSMTRCRDLHLTQFTLTYTNFSKIRESSVLQSLTLDSISIVPSFDLGSQVAPSDLHLDNVHLHTFFINWNNLTEFSAHLLYVDEILFALSLAPQMTTCLQESVQSRVILSPDGHQIISHPQLKALDIDFDCEDYESIVSFFQSATFPNLTDFSCHVGDEVFPTIPFLELLARSSCPIEIFSITRTIITGEEVIQIAKALPSITSFSLHPTTMRNQPPLDSFYNALCLDLRYADRIILPGDPVLLPLLQRLIISIGRPFPWKWLPGLFQYEYNHGDEETHSPGRPHLKDIFIQCHALGAHYDDMDDEPAPEVFSTALIDDWKTFAELMELRFYVNLDLQVQQTVTRWDMAELFDLSYKKLEATVGKASDSNRRHMERWLMST